MPNDLFYHSSEWKALRLKALKRDHWRCVNCQAPVSARGTSRVNHKLSRKDRPDLSLVLSNLETLCAACDNQHHSEKATGIGPGSATADGWPMNPSHHWNKKT